MISLLYSTFPSCEEALVVAHTLLAEKLIACANIVPGVTSVFMWQGEPNQQQEAILFAKTTREKTDAVIARISELHPYELPSIVTLPVEAGLPEFLHWVEKEVR